MLEKPDAEAAQDARLAAALAALASPVRLNLLRQVRTPRALREIHLKPQGGPAPWGSPERNLTRQTVKAHLERLVEIDAVVAREAERTYGETIEYVLNHQALYALAERFRQLANLRAAEEPRNLTLHAGAAPAPPFSIQGPCLVLVKGLDEGRTFDLTPARAGTTEWTLGRRRGLDISLEYDPFVSAENSLIVRDEGTYHVQDLPESVNGTRLNFQPLPRGHREPLKTGDLIGVGRSILMFRG